MDIIQPTTNPFNTDDAQVLNVKKEGIKIAQNILKFGLAI